MKEFIGLHKKRPPRSGLINDKVNEKVRILGNWLHAQINN